MARSVADVQSSVPFDVDDWYRRYIDTFNSQDREAFLQFYAFPLTIVPRASREAKRPDAGPIVLQDAEKFSPAMPDHWARSTIDSVVEVGEVAPLALRPGVEATEQRRGVLATATRWNTDGDPYEQVQALYLLSLVDGAYRIRVLAELANALRPS